MRGPDYVPASRIPPPARGWGQDPFSPPPCGDVSKSAECALSADSSARRCVLSGCRGTLAGAAKPGCRGLYAGDGDLCPGKDVLPVGDERDEPPMPVCTARRPMRRALRLRAVCASVCVDSGGEGHAGVDGGAGSLCAPGACALMCSEAARGVRVFGVVAGVGGC